jgi:hypothetical protein
MSQDAFDKAYREGLAKDFRAAIEEQFGKKPENLFCLPRPRSSSPGEGSSAIPGQEADR